MKQIWRLKAKLPSNGRIVRRFIRSRKAKGIWIMILCTCITLLCSAHRQNNVDLSRSYALIDNVADDKKSVIGVDMIENENSRLKTLQLNKEVPSKEVFLGFPETLSDPSKLNESKETFIHTLNQESRQNNPNIGNDNDKNGLGHNKIKVGILIPSSTRRMKRPALEKLSLTKICIPSIYKTIEMKYTYVIYVGIDKGDYLESVKNKLETMFSKVRSVVTIGGTFTKTVNAIAREAYRDGMDYLVRINDDTCFVSNNWTSGGIAILQNYTPPNFGVVGPTCHEGHTGILTHDMVHRSHLEIFDFYYPPYFDNWWADTWITKVYRPNRSTKVLSWIVRHQVSYHRRRYKVDRKQHTRLGRTLTFDKERLSKYLSTYKR